QIALGNANQPVRADDDAVPFGALAPLAARPVIPALAGRHAQIADASAILERFDLRIGTQIADENDLVDAAGHEILQMMWRPMMAVGESPSLTRGRASASSAYRQGPARRATAASEPERDRCPVGNAGREIGQGEEIAG